MKTLRTLLVTPLLALVATSMTMGQAPDCTGISPIFNANADLDGELTTVSVASGLSRPVFVTSPPGDRERLFIVQQDGLIRILENGTLLANEFLDVSGITESPADGCGGNCEQGLLGLTFDPNYETNGYFYIMHTLAGAETEIVARYERDPDSPNQALTNSRVVVITIPSGAANHNGGSLAFSPTDGRLYVGTGDGGNFCNTFQTSQNLQALNGKMLRLDVSSLPYTTTGNPYHGSPTGLDEIWSLGLRNPYRWSFDRVTGNLLIGDVGQNNWEEVDCALDGVSGQNYGWDFHEGNACPPPACGGNTNDCNPADYVAPILQYSLAGSPCSVIGGYVYRGCRMPDLHGTYFYADFCAANIESFRTDQACSLSTEVTRTADLNDSGQAIGSIVGFGEDDRGELYIVDRGGEVFKIVPTLSVMELSGSNADQLMMSATTWFWEDLEASSGHAINSYRIYRSSVETGPFRCKANLTQNQWPGGDPATPNEGEVFYYVVAASGVSGLTKLGFATDGTERLVDPGICL